VSHTHQVAGAAPAAHTTLMLPQLNVSSSSLRTSRIQAKVLSGVPFTPCEISRRVICWVTAEMAHRPRLQHCPPQSRSRQEFAHSNLAACICHTRSVAQCRGDRRSHYTVSVQFRSERPLLVKIP